MYVPMFMFCLRCIPFYFTGCGGNENNFETLEECKKICPTTFSPVISFTEGSSLLINRNQSEARISVSIRANPAPSVRWSHNGRNISRFDSQFEVADDLSLIIRNPSFHNGGQYSVVASNGVGGPAEAYVNVIIYPIAPTITLTSEKSIYEPGEEAILSCNIEGSIN